MFRLATRRAYTASARVFSTEAAASGELMVNFATPYAPIVRKQAVEMITLPGEGGVYAITKDHAPTVSQLQPGVVTINHIGVSVTSFLFRGLHVHCTCCAGCAILCLVLFAISVLLIVCFVLSNFLYCRATWRTTSFPVASR
jgi:hypothetical protein